MLSVVLAGVITLGSCERAPEEIGGFPVATNANCLTDITLLDQNGRDVSLASLKGRPLLFDFIYTRCPGPCVTLTAQMKAVARRLGGNLGTTVGFVSISVDPEHDRPPQLLSFAKERGADLAGWQFLTGTPEQIDQVMACFMLRRQGAPNGDIDHVLEFFLVGSDGRPLLQYLAARADPDRIAGDLEKAAAGKQVLGRVGAARERRGMRPTSPWATLVAAAACLCIGAVLAVQGPLSRPPAPALTIDAVAHQWWWEFEYPTLGITTYDELHVPGDSVVRFRMASADVIHTFWMPGVDQAVILVPGRWRELDVGVGAPGEWYGTCDASCGCGTVCMRFRIVASARDDFSRWVAEQVLLSDPPQRPPQKAAPNCALAR